ncbi:MAG: PTS sugar transporter subunit IIA [Thermoanaerobaculia bacterium]
MLIGSGEAAEGGAGVRQDRLVDSRLVFSGLPGSAREEILRELADRVGSRGLVPDPAALFARLIERERLGCTGLGGGIAIPHCKLADLSDVLVAVATTAAPVDFGAADGVPVRLLFVVVSPAHAAAAHLQALARISRLLRTPGVAEALRGADSQESLQDAVREAEATLPVTS